MKKPPADRLPPTLLDEATGTARYSDGRLELRSGRLGLIEVRPVKASYRAEVAGTASIANGTGSDVVSALRALSRSWAAFRFDLGLPLPPAPVYGWLPKPPAPIRPGLIDDLAEALANYFPAWER